VSYSTNNYNYGIIISNSIKMDTEFYICFLVPLLACELYNKLNFLAPYFTNNYNFRIINNSINVNTKLYICFFVPLLAYELYN
jgi:hypothetical protein